MTLCISVRAPLAAALLLALVGPACGELATPEQPATRAAIDPAASPGLLAYYGGRVLSNAKVYAVNWNHNVSSAVSSKVAAMYRAVLDSEHIDWLAEYNTVGRNGLDGNPGSNQRIGRGSLAGQLTLNPSNTATTLTDGQIRAELAHQLDIGALPAPDPNSYYAVNFPSGITIRDGNTGCPTCDVGRGCFDFCGYHRAFSYNGRDVYNGVLPSLSCQSTSSRRRPMGLCVERHAVRRLPQRRRPYPPAVLEYRLRSPGT